MIDQHQNSDEQSTDRRAASFLSRGAFVVATLREPREKLWGVLDAVTDAGVYLRGADVGSFDELARATLAGEAVFGIADLFFPAWRIERIARDAASGTIPSLAEEFLSRTGRDAAELFAAADAPGGDTTAEVNVVG